MKNWTLKKALEGNSSENFELYWLWVYMQNCRAPFTLTLQHTIKDKRTAGVGLQNPAKIREFSAYL